MASCQPRPGSTTLTHKDDSCSDLRLKSQAVSAGASRMYMFYLMLNATTAKLIPKVIIPTIGELFGRLKKNEVYKGVPVNKEHMKTPFDFVKELLPKELLPLFTSFEDVQDDPTFMLNLLKTFKNEFKDSEDKVTRLDHFFNSSMNISAQKWDESKSKEAKQILTEMVISFASGKYPSSEALSEIETWGGEEKQTLLCSSSNSDSEMKNINLNKLTIILAQFEKHGHNEERIKEFKRVVDHIKEENATNRGDQVDGTPDDYGTDQVTDSRGDGIGSTTHSASLIIPGMEKLRINEASSGRDTTDNVVSSVRAAGPVIGSPLLPDEILEKIAERFGKDWRTIGLYLRIPSSRLDEFEAAKELNHWTIEMLKYWRVNTPTPEKPKEKLKAALMEAGRTDLAEYVDEHVGKLVEEFELLDVSKQLGGEWRAVGTYLGVEHRTIESITNAPKTSIKDAAFKMLTYWQSQFKAGENKKEILSNALKKAKRIDIVEWVEEHIKWQ